MNNIDFKEKLLDLNIEYNQNKLDMLEQYYNLLVEYNSHTNITAITNKEDVYLKHFYDSLILTKFIDLTEINTMIDIGSGAGFPGIVIKIFFPNINLTVLDSNNKKTKFISLVVDKLNLNNVNIINLRAEDYAKENLNKFDLVTSRAVAYADIITELSIPFVNLNGNICLMKGNSQEEIDLLNKHQKDLNIKNISINKYILNNDERNVIIIKKDKLTTNVKNYSQIVKRSKIWNR